MPRKGVGEHLFFEGLVFLDKQNPQAAHRVSADGLHGSIKASLADVCRAWPPSPTPACNYRQAWSAFQQANCLLLEDDMAKKRAGPGCIALDNTE